MHLLEAILLGIIQGLTEFLPISSSAHLLIVPRLLHWPDPGAAFTAVTQLGTLAAVLIYFAKDIVRTLLGAFRPTPDGADKSNPERRLLIAVAIGTVPICVIGLALKKQITGDIHNNLTLIASMLIGMAVLLAIAEYATRKVRPLSQVTWRDGLIVGLAQAISLIPGASRSGSTLTGAFFTGLSREAALRFSFLLSIPAVLLSGLLELKDVIRPEPGTPPNPFSGTDTAIATVVAGIVGYACIAFLMKYLARHSALVFVIYRIALGVTLLVLLSMGKL